MQTAVGNDHARIVLQQNEIFMTEARGVDNAKWIGALRLLGKSLLPYIFHPVL